MATVNRYTQTENTTYEPRTLQELMLVPVYKRKQHDETNAAIAEYETKLAEAQALDPHGDTLNEEQNKLYQRMAAQRDKLESEGFSQSSKSNFIRFNKEYQQAVGASGKIGKIGAAKEAYDKRAAQILDYSIKAGNDPGQSQERLNEQFAKYSEKYAQDGKIENFQGELPPAYYDLYDDISKTKSQLGHTITTTKGEETYEIIPEPNTGGFVFKTQSGQILTKENAGARGAALLALENKYLNTAGPGYKSLMGWNGGDLEQTKAAIQQGLNTMRIFEEQNTLQDKYSLQMPAKGKESDPTKPETPTLMAYTSTSKVAGMKSLADTNNTIKELRANGDDAGANRVEARLRVVEDEYNYSGGDARGTVGETERVPSPIYEAKNEAERAYREIYDAYPDAYSVNVSAGGNTQADVQDKISFEDIQKAVKEGNLSTSVDKSQGGGRTKRIYGTINGQRVTIARYPEPTEGFDPNWEALQKFSAVQNAYQNGLDKKLLNETNQNIGIKFTRLAPAKLKEVANTFVDVITSNNDVELTSAKLITGDANFGPGQTIETEDLLHDEHGEKIEGEDTELTKQQLMDYLITNPEYIVPRGVIGQTENGVPAMEAILKVPEEGGTTRNYFIKVEIPKLNVTGTNISGPGETIIKLVEDFGGTEGAQLAFKMRQSVDYKDIVPTFDDMNFSNDKKIKSYIGNGTTLGKKLNGSLKDREIDIDVKRDAYGKPVYSFKLKKQSQGEGGYNIETESLTWGHLIDETQKGTQSQIVKLAESSIPLTMKLVDELKKILKVPNLTKDYVTEEQIDNAFAELKGSGNYDDNSMLITPESKPGLAINSDDYYDLLDLISAIQ